MREDKSNSDTLLILIILFFSFGGASTCDAQSRMSYHGYIGASYLNDQSAHIVGDRMMLQGAASYWVNSKVGVGASLSHTDWTLKDFGDRVESSFYNLSLPLTLNATQILGVESKRFSVLFSGGPGISFIRTDNHSEKVFAGSLSVEPMVYFYKNLALSMRLAVIGNVSQDKTFGGEYNTDAEGLTSVVPSASIGLVWKAKWPKAKPVVQPQPIQTTINNTWDMTVTKYYEETPGAFAIFFAHDKASWNEMEASTNNLTIYRIKQYAKENPDATIVLTSYASNTDSSHDYNFKLADKRAKYVEAIIRHASLTNEVSIVTIGKDVKEMYHPIARAVLVGFKDE